MNGDSSHPRPVFFLPHSGFEQLVRSLRRDGYTVLAPVVADDAIALRPVNSAAEIAHAVADAQQPGSYRLASTDSDTIFDYALGAGGPKRYFFSGRVMSMSDESPEPEDRRDGVRTIRVGGISRVAGEGALHVTMRGREVDPAIRSLRNLLYCGEWIESHALHMFTLRLPDFLGDESATSMARTPARGKAGGP
jgi:hypothetical protein